MGIKFTVRGVKELQAMLKALPLGVKITAMRAFTEYIIGDETHGLKHEPNRVSHGPGNPYQWQSDRQRKAFFASDGFGGGIPTQRTGETAGAWEVMEQNSNWTQVKIVNDSDGAPWVYGENQQRGHAADGWRKYGEIVASNTAGAIRHAMAEVKAWLKSRGW